MLQSCAAASCKRASCALCHCCQQNLCIFHLNEHNDLLNSLLNPLADEINTLGDRITTLRNHESIRDCRQKLQEWREDSHQTIDRFFERQCQELDRLLADKLDKPCKEHSCIQSKVMELIHSRGATRRDIDSCASTICQLNEELNKIEGTYFQINIRSPLVDDSLIRIKETNKKEIDLSTLSPVYKTTEYPSGSYCPSACNDRLLLIHQTPNLCFIDAGMTIVKQILWSHGAIRDICWSSTLGRFIVIEENSIFTVDESMMILESVQTIEKRRWFSCACSDTILFLTTGVRGSSIMEFSLLPSISAIKEWKSPKTCTNEEFINGIVYNNAILALMIKNKIEKNIRMELRSCERLDRIWSLPLDILCHQNIAFRFCSLSCDGWLVADYETGSLIQITNDGKLKAIIPYDAKPYYISVFTSNMLVVSAEKGVNFHKI